MSQREKTFRVVLRVPTVEGGDGTPGEALVPAEAPGDHHHFIGLRTREPAPKGVLVRSSSPFTMAEFLKEEAGAMGLEGELPEGRVRAMTFFMETIDQYELGVILGCRFTFGESDDTWEIFDFPQAPPLPDVNLPAPEWDDAPLDETLEGFHSEAEDEAEVAPDNAAAQDEPTSVVESSEDVAKPEEPTPEPAQEPSADAYAIDLADFLDDDQDDEDDQDDVEDGDVPEPEAETVEEGTPTIHEIEEAPDNPDIDLLAWLDVDELSNFRGDLSEEEATSLSVADSEEDSEGPLVEDDLDEGEESGDEDDFEDEDDDAFEEEEDSEDEDDSEGEGEESGDEDDFEDEESGDEDDFDEDDEDSEDEDDFEEDEDDSEDEESEDEDEGDSEDEESEDEDEGDSEDEESEDEDEGDSEDEESEDEDEGDSEDEESGDEDEGDSEDEESGDDEASDSEDETEEGSEDEAAEEQSSEEPSEEQTSDEQDSDAVEDPKKPITP